MNHIQDFKANLAESAAVAFARHHSEVANQASADATRVGSEEKHRAAALAHGIAAGHHLEAANRTVSDYHGEYHRAMQDHHSKMYAIHRKYSKSP